MRWDAWGCPRIDGGIWHFETLHSDTDEDDDEEPWFETEPGLEVLYRTRCRSAEAPIDSMPCAWRTFPTQEDSLAGLEPGCMVVFAFHPWWFDETQFTAATELALRWLVTGSDF